MLLANNMCLRVYLQMSEESELGEKKMQKEEYKEKESQEIASFRRRKEKKAR